MRAVARDRRCRRSTLNALIVATTSPDDYDRNFMRTFLLTYQSFVRPRVLLRRLMKRYEVPADVCSAAAGGASLPALRLADARLVCTGACRTRRHRACARHRVSQVLDRGVDSVRRAAKFAHLGADDVITGGRSDFLMPEDIVPELRALCSATLAAPTAQSILRAVDKALDELAAADAGSLSLLFVRPTRSRSRARPALQCSQRAVSGSGKGLLCVSLLSACL